MPSDAWPISHNTQLKMNRRAFFANSAGLALLTSTPGVSASESQFNYTPELLEIALDSGGPVLLGFHAAWCSTCRTQERVVASLLEENEIYANVTIIIADWDEQKRSDLVKELRIPRRSTLVMFNKGEEVDRVIAQTSRASIENLFKAVT